MDVQALVDHFTKDIASYRFAETVGMEIETQFFEENDWRPVSLETSQRMFRTLVKRYGFTVHAEKHELITELRSPHGDKVGYELGRHNIEVSSVPLPPEKLILHVWRAVLIPLEEAGKDCGAFAMDYPVPDEAEHMLMGRLESALDTREDLLVIPDARDAAWLALDGKGALNLLARTSSVQVTIDVPPASAIRYLNRLGKRILQFLADYTQDYVWRKYIKESKAGYDELRYGGPLLFKSIEDYCAKLAAHPVVVGATLVPFAQATAVDIPLFLRSVWWYFRLRRYGRKLCIEVRPLARRNDFGSKMWNTLYAMGV